MTIEETEKRLLELGFTPSGKRLGEGAWGIVDEYQDINGQNWAIKKYRTTEISRGQADYRNLNLETITTEKESIPLSAVSHGLCPRITGNGFVAMPVYGHFEDILKDGKPLDISRALDVSKKIAHSLGYFHKDRKRAYCDLKPANILIDEKGNPILTDFSAATFASPSKQSSDPRDNIGEIQTRAYECFREGSHPDEKSDVYALGAFIGRLITGYFPHEKRLANAKDPVKEMQEIGEGEADGRVRDYVNSTPNAFRYFLMRCLDFNPKRRYENGVEAEKGLISAIKAYEHSRPMSRLKRWGIAAAATALVGGMGINYYLSTINKGVLEEKLYDEQIRASTRERVSFIRREYSMTDTMDALARKRLRMWLEKFCEFDKEKFDYKGDKRTAFACYIESVWDRKLADKEKDKEWGNNRPPITVYTAIQMSGGKTDYNTLEPIIQKLNPDLYWAVHETTSSGIDSFARGYLPDESERRVRDDLWKNAQKSYELKKAEEETKKLKEQRNKVNSAMMGDLDEPYKNWRYIKK